MNDLIDECAQDIKSMGYAIRKEGKYGITVGSLNVNNVQKANQLGFDKGVYYIINSPLTYQLDFECHDYLSHLISKTLTKIFKVHHIDKNAVFLVVGIGNPDILADSLGKKVVDKVEIAPFDKQNNIYKFCPNVHFNTGLSTQKIIDLLAKALNVDCLILIDSLATNQISRLGTSFQINSSGITPGSALCDKNKKISEISIGKKCISIGVPFMIRAGSLTKCEDEDLLLAPKDIHENIETASSIIANAINLAVGR